MATNRRAFIRTTSLAAAGISSMSSFKSSAFAGAPSDQLNIALIGVRNMGFGILERHLEIPGVKCVALCDVDKPLLERRAADVLNRYGQSPKLYGDFRALLENKEIDAVIIGTPDHWHCLQTVYACEAGKDVYVEKPMANSIAECDLMVRAARKYNRIVQVGQQQRSGPEWQAVNRLVKNGTIGTLRKVNIWCNFNYGVGQPVQPDQPVPEGVDFDMWLGPAPQRSFNASRFHGSWRMFWDYGGGLLTDWGVHLIDMALWSKDIVSAPTVTLASGGNLSFPGHAHETFDTQSVIWQYENLLVTWDHTAGTEKGPWDQNYGLAFIGDNATIVVNRSGYKIIPEWDNRASSFKASKGDVPMKGENHGDHVSNFIDSIRSRKAPVCPPEIGRAAAVAAHTANLCIRSGDYRLTWDSKLNRFSDSSRANSMLQPVYRKPWELPVL